MKSTPRSRLAAAKPVRSPTTPPPSATSVTLRSGRWSSSAFISRPKAANSLLLSPAGTVTIVAGDAGLLERGDEARAIERRHGFVGHNDDSPRRQQARAKLARAIDQAGTDQYVVAAAGEADRNGVHGHAAAPVACGARWRRSASRTCSVVMSAGWAVEFDHEIGLGIDGVTLVHQARENILGVALAQQRPVRALAHAVVQHLEVGAQPDGDGMSSHQGPRLGIHIGTAAGREYMRRTLEQALRSPSARRCGIRPRRIVRRIPRSSSPPRVLSRRRRRRRAGRAGAPAVCRSRSCRHPSARQGPRCAAAKEEKMRP